MGKKSGGRGGGGAKGKKGQKDKGPKGKRAREKAKLDRRWGERLPEDTAASDGGGGEGKTKKSRYGRTRLAAVVPKNKENPRASESSVNPAVEYRDDDSSVSEGDDTASASDADDDDDDDDGNEDDDGDDSAALESLLRSIGSKGRKRGQSGQREVRRRLSSSSRSAASYSDGEDGAVAVAEGEDDRCDRDDDDERTTYERSAAETASALSGVTDTCGHRRDADEAANDEAADEATKEDPFVSHFSMTPLPEDTESALAEVKKRRGKEMKLPRQPSPSSVTDHLSPTLEIRLSDNLSCMERCRSRMTEGGLHRDEEAEGKATKNESSTRLWNAASKGPYGNVREALRSNWLRINKSAVRENADSSPVSRDIDSSKSITSAVFSSLQSTIFPPLSSYADLLFTATNRSNRRAVDNLVTLHVINHVLTSRGRVRRHDRRIAEMEKRRDDKSGVRSKAKNGIDRDDDIDDDDDNDTDRWRDQGYTRPKVLILLPTRGTCLDFVERMMTLLEGEGGGKYSSSVSADQTERFRDEYGGGSIPPSSSSADDNVDDEDDEIERRRKAVLKSKGEDWNDLFGDEVNPDDDFKLGISLTPNAVVKPNDGGDNKSKKRKKGKTSSSSSSSVSMKLYTEFYRSDIIVCSPLGLKMVTSKDRTDGNDENNSGDGDVDFLSSVEICVVGRSEVLLMQNWDHVNSSLSSLNHQPKKTNRDTDFSRVRNHLLAGYGKHWKQLVVLSDYADAHILSTFKRFGTSVSGYAQFRRRVPADDASVCDVLVGAKHVFQRVPCKSHSMQGDDRLKYFIDVVLKQIVRLNQKRTMIFVPSYFEFVALRNVLIKREKDNVDRGIDFVSVTEYSRVSEVSRGRARFHQGRKSLLLYTGRAHYFMRHTIRGARHVIYFGLPENADFYPGLMNAAGGEDDDDGGGVDADNAATAPLDIRAPVSCLSLFTKYEAHALERIVGTNHCERMVKGGKNTFLLTSRA